MQRLGTLPRWLAWLVLLVPAYELTAHAWITSHVPSDADYRAAADYVRSQLRPRDLLHSVPAFTDPLLRRHLGDRISLAMAGRSDDAAFERAWVLSIRGATPAFDRAPEFEREFGRVRVLRYALGKSPVLLDLVQSLASAEVSIVKHGAPRRCPRRTGGTPRGGGLGKPVLMPIAERYECEPEKPWLFVGSIVMEDLSNTPRHCVWHHPQGSEPVAVRFADVPLGDELMFYGGIYYEHERMRQGGPVEVAMFVDGEQRGHMVHTDGEGWKRQRIPTGAPPGKRGELRIEVRAKDPRQRSFCWAASTRRRGVEAR
jgi:hypothetical protein